jgi:Flp pilus assembly protein TadD
VLGQPERALVNLQTLSDTYPTGEEPQQVFFLEGLALAALGRHSDAVVSFTAARDRGQPSPEILFRLAEAELRAGHENEARQSLHQALALDPAHSPSRGLLSKLDIAASGQANRRSSDNR